MEIARIRAYQVALPLHEGSYRWSGGKSVSVFDSTTGEVETDAEITGWGEVCPLGPFYLRRARRPHWHQGDSPPTSSGRIRGSSGASTGAWTPRSRSTPT